MSPVTALATWEREAKPGTLPEPVLPALGKEQVKCKENPVSVRSMTLSNIQLLAVRGAGGWLGGWPWHPGGVLADSIETTEINRGGEGRVLRTGPVPQEEGLRLLTCPVPPKPCLPGSQCRGTDTQHRPTGCQERIIM